MLPHVPDAQRRVPPQGDTKQAGAATMDL